MNALKKNVGIAALLLSLVCLLTVVVGSHQAVLSKPSQLRLAGEYSRDGENWQPLDGADFSSWEGDLYLRGHFDLDIPEGLRISWYRNHIGVSMAVNRQSTGYDIIAFYLQEGEPLTPDVCGSLWDYQLSPGIMEEDVVEFHLYDPHRHGNSGAYAQASPGGGTCWQMPPCWFPLCSTVFWWCCPLPEEWCCMTDFSHGSSSSWRSALCSWVVP